jgi:hypothetical protein
MVQLTLGIERFRSPSKVNQHFGGTHRLHLQSRRVSEAKLACCLLYAGFLLGLLLNPDDRGDMSLRNVS